MHVKKSVNLRNILNSNWSHGPSEEKTPPWIVIEMNNDREFWMNKKDFFSTAAQSPGHGPFSTLELNPGMDGKFSDPRLVVQEDRKRILHRPITSKKWMEKNQFLSKRHQTRYLFQLKMSGWSEFSDLVKKKRIPQKIRTLDTVKTTLVKIFRLHMIWPVNGAPFFRILPGWAPFLACSSTSTPNCTTSLEQISRPPSAWGWSFFSVLWPLIWLPGGDGAGNGAVGSFWLFTKVPLELCVSWR